jgi:hypothetical protein
MAVLSCIPFTQLSQANQHQKVQLKSSLVLLYLLSLILNKAQQLEK